MGNSLATRERSAMNTVVLPILLLAAAGAGYFIWKQMPKSVPLPDYTLHEFDRLAVPVISTEDLEIEHSDHRNGSVWSRDGHHRQLLRWWTRPNSVWNDIDPYFFGETQEYLDPGIRVIESQLDLINGHEARLHIGRQDDAEDGGRRFAVTAQWTCPPSHRGIVTAIDGFDDPEEMVTSIRRFIASADCHGRGEIGPLGPRLKEVPKGWRTEKVPAEKPLTAYLREDYMEQFWFTPLGGVNDLLWADCDYVVGEVLRGYDKYNRRSTPRAGNPEIVQGWEDDLPRCIVTDRVTFPRDTVNYQRGVDTLEFRIVQCPDSSSYAGMTSIYRSKTGKSEFLEGIREHMVCEPGEG